MERRRYGEWSAYWADSCQGRVIEIWNPDARISLHILLNKVAGEPPLDGFGDFRLQFAEVVAILAGEHFRAFVEQMNQRAFAGGDQKPLVRYRIQSERVVA